MTVTYLLDTNAISHAARFPSGPVAHQVARHQRHLITSVIVESELRFGIAQKAGNRAAGRIGRFLDSINIVAFNSDAARHYGDIRAMLEARGQSLDAMNLLVAAHARSLDACLITHNIKRFERIPDLDWKNWQVDA